MAIALQTMAGPGFFFPTQQDGTALDSKQEVQRREAAFRREVVVFKPGEGSLWGRGSVKLKTELWLQLRYQKRINHFFFHFNAANYPYR